MHIETTRRRKNGSPVDVSEVSFRVIADGKCIAYYVILRDITESKRALEKLQKAQADLAHLSRITTMGELAASIAHEINQPLSGVVSNGSACLRWLAGDPPNVDEARENARRIVRDGKRAGEVIGRIRALTKRATTPREKLDLNETIREVLALVGDEAKKQSVIPNPSVAVGASLRIACARIAVRGT